MIRSIHISMIMICLLLAAVIVHSKRSSLSSFIAVGSTNDMTSINRLLQPRSSTTAFIQTPNNNKRIIIITSITTYRHSNKCAVVLHPLYALGNNNNNNDDNNESSSNNNIIAESDQLIIGVIGIVSSFIVLYSEYTLKMTGCGLPAGPYGIIGASEGISYLVIIGITAFSLYTKLSTGSGLPNGPFGILGAAEGLSYLTILIGIIVLIFQITNYGYIPNAIPIEGGMCM